MVEEVVKRPVRLNFLSVLAFFVILFQQFHDGRTLPQIPSEQYQANIYIPQAPTDFSHPSETGRDFSPPTAAAVNQFPVQEDQLNERTDYESHPNEEDYINERPRGRPYAGSFAEELDGATAGEDPEKSIPGSPEQDYPVFEEIPRTSFTCRDKPVPAYYADVEARCQVFHICDVGGHKHSFLCPNGSVFNQKYLVCDWWYDFACENAENLFSKQLQPSESTTTNNVNNAAQTFSNDGQLIFNQNLPGDYNLNPVFNPGLPQTQLDTPQQVFTGNYYIPQNDIFHGAETGYPGRDQIHANLDNVQQNNNHNENVNNNNTNLNNGDYNNVNQNSQNYNNHEHINVANLNNGNLNNGGPNNVNPNNENINNANFNNGNPINGNINNENFNNGNSNTGNLNNGNFNYENSQNNNYNKENVNNTSYSNNQNVNKPGEDLYNAEKRNNNGEDQSRSHIDKQSQKLSHEFGDNGKHSNNFQNNRNEPQSNRKHYKIGRRVKDNSKQSTTQSSLNLNTRERNLDVTPEQINSNSAANKVVKTAEQVANIVNDTVGVQRNENNYNNNEQQYRTDSNGFNGNNYQTNLNNFNTPTTNTQYIPPNTYREGNNNFQTNQYTRPDVVQ